MIELNRDKYVLVAGAGITGRNAVSFALQAGLRPILYDGNLKLDTEAVKQKIGRSDFEIVLGPVPDELLPQIGVCVISPGIPLLTSPIALQMTAAGIPIISEIELAYYFSKGRIAAVTGTNGKTTTTSLIGHICRAWNPSTFVVGNIGHAYTQEVLNTREASITCLELSAFQMETLHGFVPEVSILTNITPDHLDRFGTMEKYIEIKHEICRLQHEDQYCVVNGDDPLLQDIEQFTRARVLRFSRQREYEEGAFLRGGSIVVRFGGREYEIIETSKLNILGAHNHENVMGAVLMAFCLGVPVEIIRRQVASFQAVAHRNEFVCTRDEVRYYNDSKATNPDSVVKDLPVIPGRVTLIAGGFDKGADYEEMCRLLPGKVKLVILMGQTAEKIYEAMKRCCPSVGVCFVNTMTEAVAVARLVARPGEAVLLSPACASWDMYPNFEVRGDEFKELVRA